MLSLSSNSQKMKSIMRILLMLVVLTAGVSQHKGCKDQPIMLIFYLLCYAAVLIKFTYYAQSYAQE